MKIVKVLFFAHLAALMFGLSGLLIALPHPELWNRNPMAVQAFTLGIRYAGSLHIVLGAAVMLLYGWLFVGRRKTLSFFVAATTISLSMELLGTGTGFPFGAYSYTDFLGFKIAGRVPFSIPLSWFYMGFTAYVLASTLAERFRPERRTLWSLGLGVYLLTVWDLVLDPAMASPHLPIHFWIWHQTGPYFGMPIRNLVGWSVTGLIFLSASRLFWRGGIALDRTSRWLPFGVYAANMGFAVALSLGAGLWWPPVLAIVLGVVPAFFALRPRAQPPGGDFGANRPIAERMALITLRAASRIILKRAARFRIEGLNHIPRTGSVLIVARHYHHLYDGCALLASVPGRVHILVALDWVRWRWLRAVMEWACASARWPVIVRRQRLDATRAILTEPAEGMPLSRGSGYRVDEARPYLRRAVTDMVQLLRAGKILAIFPEAYPNVDPGFTPKAGSDEWLPFRDGFIRVAARAERDGRTRVAIVPAGLAYARDERTGRWCVTLRFGSVVTLRDDQSVTALLRVIEQRVRALSAAGDTPEPRVPNAAREVMHRSATP